MKAKHFKVLAMNSKHLITFINTYGVAACLGGSESTCDDAPHVIRLSQFQDHLTEQNLALQWQKIVTAPEFSSDKTAQPLASLKAISHEIASLTYQYTIQQMSENTVNRPFLLISGDHSSAIGTWSGVMQAKTLGLIWIDAHLDAHTLKTSPSGNVHGMPLSLLLNKADKNLQATYPRPDYPGSDYPKLELSPLNQNHYLSGHNLSLLGVRSFEPQEQALLKQVNARVCYMEQLQQHSNPVQLLNDIAEDLLSRCDVIGISLDLDAIDPEEAPAVETPEKNGIPAEMLLSMLNNFSYKNQLIGFEISEFNPINDINRKTEKLIMQLIAAIFAS